MHLKESLYTSLFSNTIFLIVSELFYVMNFTNLSLVTFHHLFDNYLLCFSITFSVCIIVDMLIYCFFCRILIKLDKLRYYFIISLIEYVILTLFLRFSFEKYHLLNLAANLSLLFAVILKTYAFFYSIYHQNLIR